MKYCIVGSSGLLAMVTYSLLLLSLVLSTADAFASVKSTAAVSSTQHKSYSSSSQSVGSTSTCLSASTAAAASVVAPPTYTLFGLNIKKSIQKKKSHKKQLFTIPSIFNSADSRPIILFDGKCNLCNGGVQLILDNDAASLDPRGNLRVAALQSRVGQILLSRLPRRDQAKVITLDTNNNDNSNNKNKSNEFKSIVVIGPNSQYWLNSAACLKIGRNLRGPLRYLALIAHLIPSFIRDPIYKLLSKYRKKLFGESAECRLWDDNYDMRYVNDELFGGRGDDSDPFADPNAPKEEVEEEEEEVDLTIGPNVKVGDTVRIVSSKAIVHTHVDGYERNGLCSVGLVGKVSRVLEQRAYPKSVVVQFENIDCGVGGSEEGDSSNDGNGGEGGASLSFEAHFYPGQLRKE